jgi:hypothetical protein
MNLADSFLRAEGHGVCVGGYLQMEEECGHRGKLKFPQGLPKESAESAYTAACFASRTCRLSPSSLIRH